MNNTINKMEAEDGQLADQYVQEFVLDHLEDVSVKKEGGGMERLPSMMSCGGGVVQMNSPPHHHLLTPPGHESDEYNVVMPPNQMIMQHNVYPETPGTPPDTPPESNSPHSPPVRSYHMEQPQPFLLQGRSQGMVDEMGWIVSNGTGGPLRQEPLDLRPNCHELDDWSQLQHPPIMPNSGKRILDYHHHHHHHHHPDDDLDMSPGTPMGSMQMQGPMSMPAKNAEGRTADDIINDDLLTRLSVRELNKRLHGFPREDVVRLKQKRRTLKNRGYAQNCRSKRLMQRHELETTNKNLQNEIHRMRLDYAKVSQEKEMYKSRYEGLRRRFIEGRENVSSSPASSTTMYM